MKRRFASFAFAFVLLAVPAAAEEPAHFTYAPKPPGTIVQSTVVYLAGQAMHSQWRGVISKKLLGTSQGTSFYQWYVSMYAIDGSTYELRYQSPRDGGPYGNVESTTDKSLWLPQQTGTIVGAAQLMAPAVEQLVVETHETGADCGEGDVTIFGYDFKRNKVVPEATVQNGCALSAKISGHSLVLSGPYYAPSAALCCPTKNSASATLRYVNGTWVEKPHYFTLFPNAFPHY